MEKDSNLLVLCQLFYPELVSTGQTLTELCEELSHMGVNIEVLCAPPTVVDNKVPVPKLMEHQGIRIKRVWSTRFPKLNLIGRIINQITFAFSSFANLLFNAPKGPILVLTNPPFLAFSCALLWKMRIGNPYIYLIFDVYPNTAVNLGVIKENGLLAKIWEWVNSFTFRHASRIIVIGRCMKDVIEEKMRRYGIEHNNKVTMIHVWSNDRLIQKTPKEGNPFIEKWGLKGKFVVSYTGNMGRFHDMETIMEATNKLRDYKDIMFLFIGEGHKKSWCVEFAKKFDLVNCKFNTYVPMEDLSALLSCADIGLVSLMEGQEGLSVPSKTFGSMSASIPVIGIMPSSSEIAKVLVEEGGGLVVRPGDIEGLVNAILSLYNDRNRMESMGKNARRAIDIKYNLNSAAKTYYKLIYELNRKI